MKHSQTLRNTIFYKGNIINKSKIDQYLISSLLLFKIQTKNQQQLLIAIEEETVWILEKKFDIYFVF